MSNSLTSVIAPVKNSILQTHVALVSVEWDVLDLLESIPKVIVLGFFDASPHSIMEGLIHLGNDDAWKDVKEKYPNLKVVLAIDPPFIKAGLFNHYEKDAIISIISPKAYVSLRASVGIGSIIQRGVTIMPKAKIGKGCKLNINVTVHHEAVIGDFCTLAPQALVLGKVILEEQVYVGAGAIILQKCHIGKGATIGAGAVVVKDVPPGVTVVGVPAKILSKC